jgi:hypothetical protein
MNILSDFKKELKELPRVEKGKFLKELHLRKESPQVLSQSLGLGVFIGFTPTVGIQTILCYLLARALKKNFLAIFLGASLPTGIPIQIPFTYLFCFKVGSYLLFGKTSFINPNFKGVNFWTIVSYFSLRNIIVLLIGSVFIGTLGGILTYFLSLWLINKKRCNPLRKNAQKNN